MASVYVSVGGATCALRAAACWIWDLLRALQNGSTSKRVFLYMTSLGFLNTVSSFTPVWGNRDKKRRALSISQRTGKATYYRIHYNMCAYSICVCVCVCVQGACLQGNT